MADGIDYILQCQEEFHTAFGIPVNEVSQALYVRLVDEEHEEWIEEYYSTQEALHKELKELADLLYVTAGLAYQHGYSLTDIKSPLSRKQHLDDSITDFVSEILVDKDHKDVVRNLVYCIFGYADSMGWDLKEAYMRVHQSNMSKLDNGQVVRREDGKVLKGPNYKPPYLKDLTNEPQN